MWITIAPRMFVVLILPFTLTAISCSENRRPVYPVRGKVLLEGAPTPEALVIFHPLDYSDPKTPQPIARVQADGAFAPTTWTAGDGAPAGRYAITITWVNERDNQSAPKEEQREPKNLLPDRYRKVETSKLEVLVKPESNELEPFRLTRK